MDGPGVTKPARSGKPWYVVAALLFVIGSGAGLVGGFKYAGSLLDLPLEFDVPGSGVLHVSLPAHYRVYQMTRTVRSGQVVESGQYPVGLILDVQRKADGKTVYLKHAFQMEPDEVFDALLGESRSARVIGVFEADQPGDYELSGRCKGRPVILAVGKGVSGEAIARFLAFVVGGSLCAGAGVLWAVLIFWRHSLAARARR